MAREVNSLTATIYRRMWLYCLILLCPRTSSIVWRAASSRGETPIYYEAKSKILHAMILASPRRANVVPSQHKNLYKINGKRHDKLEVKTSLSSFTETNNLWLTKMPQP